MGGKSPSQPAPIDPIATAKARAGFNKEAVLESARVNQITEVSPFGTSTFTGEIGTPGRTRTTTLDPTAQKTLDSSNQLALMLANLGGDISGNVRNAIGGGPLNFEGLPGLRGTGPAEFDRVTSNRDELESAFFERGARLLRPEFETGRRRLETDLDVRGLPIAGDANRRAREDFGTRENRAFEQLALASVDAGSAEESRALADNRANLASAGAEASRLFGTSQAARAQGINERTALRAQPFNELAALIQGAPAIGTPSFQPAASFGVASPDLIGATAIASQQAQANAAAQNRSSNAFMQGLFGLGSAGIAAAPLLLSDRRIKTDIRHRGALSNGINWYTFRFLGSSVVESGVLAQEVAQVRPWAVHDIAGVLHVDYSALV